MKHQRIALNQTICIDLFSGPCAILQRERLVIVLAAEEACNTYLPLINYSSWLASYRASVGDVFNFMVF